MADLLLAHDVGRALGLPQAHALREETHHLASVDGHLPRHIPERVHHRTVVAFPPVHTSFGEIRRGSLGIAEGWYRDDLGIAEWAAAGTEVGIAVSSAAEAPRYVEAGVVVVQDAAANYNYLHACWIAVTCRLSPA